MKIAINGAGVAGPTLAYWLREYGHEPVLFERAGAPRRGGYLVDFWGLGYEIADRMGLIPGLRRGCYEMEWMSMVDGHGRETARVDLAPMRDALEGRFISIPRADLAAALLGACDGIPARFGVHVTGIDQDGGGVTATLSDGRRERFDLLFGADGLHSEVRALAFGPESRFEQFLDCYIAAVRLHGYPHRDELTYVSHTVLERQAARVSLDHDETLVLLVCRADLIDGDPAEDQQKAALRRAFGGMGWEVPELLDAVDQAEDVFFDRISQTFVPSWSSGRVGLLGDAAACPSLLAGEGTGLAMLEAYVLAGELCRARGDFARAFAAYDARLRSFVTAKQKGARPFRGFFAPKTPLALGVRSVAVHALANRHLARRLLPRALHDDFDLPEYMAA